MSDKLLEVKNLSVEYDTEISTVYAVNGLDLNLNYGETLGLVGETGAGKTTTALSVIQLLPEGIGFVTDGSIKLDGVDMLNAPEEKIRAMRGSVVSMIFQDPMSALNPVMTVGAQIMEVLKIHHPEQSTAQLEARVDEMMELVGIPAKRKVEYPHQFSGGMKQRIVIAIALACEPKLILADEPTTALDVTIQAQMLGLINELQKRLNTAMILITHDLGVVAQTCEKVMVMYAGEAIEYGTAEDIFETTQRHPYTQGLFNAIPKLDENTKRLEAIEGMMADPTQKIEGCRFADRCKYATAACKKGPEDAGGHTGPLHPLLPVRSAAVQHLSREEMTMEEKILIEAKNLKKYFKVGASSQLHAVDGVNFKIKRGTTLGVVGESGCGKSTLGRLLLRLYDVTDGQIIYDGTDITKLNAKELKPIRARMQMIFQDPSGSLDPRKSVKELIGEPLKIYKACKNRDEYDARIAEIMETVGLDERYAESFSHELDGGRRQRIGIGRALAMDPEFIICDEPVSALDVSIQAQILNLLMDLQDEKKLTYVFITHDLSVVKHISHEIMVMYLGQCVEYAKTEDLFKNPLHPYTKGLLDAVPIPSLKAKKLSTEVMRGELTSPVDPAPGCRFAARCPYATDACRGRDIPLKEVEPGHFVSCTRF